MIEINAKDGMENLEMALDGLVIHGLVKELKTLIGGKIYRIHQPSEHDIVMQIRAQGENVRLLLSANPTYPRVHLTKQQFQNPQEAPMFCMLMRKHFEGGLIENIRQIGLERILHIDVRQRDELGDAKIKTVVVELMGRHSNIILFDPENGHIYDGIHHVTPAISSYRVVLPGSAYVAPPEQQKSNPFFTDKSEFLALFQQQQKEDSLLLEDCLIRHFSGLSPLVAREIVHRAGVPSARLPLAIQEAELLWSAFSSVLESLKQGQVYPNIVTDSEKGKAHFSVVMLTHLQGQIETFQSVNECLEFYYTEKAQRDLLKQKGAELIRVMNNELNKNLNKIKKLRQTVEEAKNGEKYRMMGELLTAHLHEVQRGDECVEVVNYYDPEQKKIKIPLNPQLSPAENAQQYFKKYNKSKTSLSAAKEQIELAEREIDYIENILQQLETASLTDMEQIRDELVQQGYLRERRPHGQRRKKTDRPPLLCYISSEGIPIYVGKNNLQNDFLTHRLAHSSDTWLHTKDIPGSHVVIRAEKFGDKTLAEAAMLAAYYSRARNSSQVPVDYTLIRHVRKPSRAKPGFVLYDHQKTLFVTPDEKRIQQLQVSVKT